MAKTIHTDKAPAITGGPYAQGKSQAIFSLQADQVPCHLRAGEIIGRNHPEASLKEHWGYLEEAGTDFDRNGENHLFPRVI